MIHPTAKIHPSASVDQPCTIGAGVRVWHFCHVREHSVVGARVQLGQNVYVGTGVRIGAGSKVQNNVSVYESVTLEEEVFCGPSCVFTNVTDPRAAIERKHEFKPTLVRRGATIGANATVLCGITVGRWAMVGAGAVLTQGIPDFALFVGVPARFAGWVSVAGRRLPGIRVGEEVSCPEDGSRYRLEDHGRLVLLTPEPPLPAEEPAP